MAGSWAAGVDRSGVGHRITLRTRTAVSGEAEIAWLTEACLRQQGRPANVATLEALPVLYPFHFDAPLAYVLSRSAHLELRANGSNQATVSLAIAA